MSTRRGSLSRTAYLVIAWLGVLGILLQVFLVGLSLLGGQPSWDAHIGLGHSYLLLPLLMVILAYVGRLPRPDKRLTWLFFGVYIFLAEIFAIIRGAVPILAALHPVLALVLFALSTLLAWRAWGLARAPSPANPSADRATP
ncbi:MAG: DUF6220 domain-containing protein [Chloroflexota bacterium]